VLRADSATTEQVVWLTSGAGKRVAWWTVRVLADGAWRTWVLPGGERRVTVTMAGSAPPTRVLVTAVDRYGSESPVVEVRSPNAR
jgi:hypothetical protein